MDGETKFCFNCGDKIDAKAEICPNCGVRVKGSRTEIKSSGLAAVLSFLIIGLGQIYNGEIVKGFLLMVLALISIVFWWAGIGFIATLVLWIYSIGDAYKTAERINAGEICT